MMCLPCDKILHPTRDEAFEHLKKLLARDLLRAKDQGKDRSENSERMTVYPCPVTEGWHVGHLRDDRPLLYHYAVSTQFNQIKKADQLRPPSAFRSRARYPALWFSRNQDWDYAVYRDPRPDTRYPMRWPEKGRAITEVFGEGLIRWGARQTVAKVCWNEYADRNNIPLLQRQGIALRGNPAEWQATYDPVTIGEEDFAGKVVCHTFDIWYDGRWVAGHDVDPAAFDQYLAGRVAAYNTAWKRLLVKLRDKPVVGTTLTTVTPDDEAEAILLEDLKVWQRVREWRQHNLPARASEYKALAARVQHQDWQRRRR